jgi:hypothetical protein
MAGKKPLCPERIITKVRKRWTGRIIDNRSGAGITSFVSGWTQAFTILWALDKGIVVSSFDDVDDDDDDDDEEELTISIAS